ncbi:HAD family hydrolase [Azoarcus olearius]|nr:HAD family phosphatase [Azoarcus olearius]
MADGTAVERTMLQAVIFDMDGLLLDSERPIRDAWIEVGREIGVSLDAATYHRVIGRNMTDVHAILGEVFGTDIYRDAAARVAALLDARHAQQGYPPKAGAAALLGWLEARGVRCGLASSSYRDKVERRLRQAGLLGYFDAIACGDEVTRGKPAPDVYLLAAQRLEAVPTACLAFEDSDNGARAALAAGMEVVLVPDLLEPLPDLAAQCTLLASLEAAVAHCDARLAGPRPPSSV